MPESVTGDTDWVPRAIPELVVYQRDTKWLCLNPDVPAWLVTTEAASLLLMLVDGKKSVSDIVKVLRDHDVPVDPSGVGRFFSDARRLGFFDDPVSHVPIPFRSRKLSAIHLHLTDRCNLSCTYCFRNSDPGVPIRRDAARFIEMFDFIKPFCDGPLTITYCGGEPLLYPGFRDVVEAASRHGFVNQLLTNGLLITDGMADFLAAHFRNVKISIDGPDRETHRATRGDNFDRVVRNIHRIAKRQIEVIAQVTVSQHNVRRVQEFKPLLPAAVRLVFTPMLPMGRGAQAFGFISDDEFAEVATIAAQAEERLRDPQFFNGMVNRSCHAGLSNLSIADTGDVYPCHLFHVDRFLLGNIFRDRFEDIFYGDALSDYVRSMDVLHNNPVCAECELRYVCGGGCKANTLHATGDYRGADLYCGFIRRSVIDNLFDSATAPLETEKNARVCSSDRGSC